MMILQDCQCNETNYPFKITLRRIWYLIKRTVNRYDQWEEMKHNHRILLTMEDRMLKDIGQSRADAVRISNSHTFWKFIFQPESNGMKDRSGQSN
ncbi:MAG: DUF1127 domain-containing protein [Desulfobacteraceae bacterium]|nr:DUF1127 domain-containing protein [Desulfobacteraceae bacterium]